MNFSADASSALRDTENNRAAERQLGSAIMSQELHDCDSVSALWVTNRASILKYFYAPYSGLYAIVPQLPRTSGFSHLGYQPTVTQQSEYLKRTHKR